MISAQRGWGGACLARDRLVRLAYLDEAGVSNAAHEPHVVVAGPIVDADKQWLDLERHLKELAGECFPKGIPAQFVFHAMDIWHGSGFFPRESFSLSDRREILSKLCAIPENFTLPIAVGHVNRAALSKQFLEINSRLTKGQLKDMCHGYSLVFCLQAIDNWMRRYTNNEVAMTIAEQAGKIQKILQVLHRIARQKENDRFHELFFKSEYIVDTLHFAQKTASPLLQIADAVAFVIRRRLALKADSATLYSQFEKQIVFQSGKEFSNIAAMPPRRLPPMKKDRQKTERRWSTR